MRYTTPKIPKKLPGTIWGITTFFNPAGYKNKKRNYDKFRRYSKRQGLKLATVELEFGSHPFELSKDDADILIQIRGDESNIMWQKERLLNVGLQNIPKDCDKVVWLDCDVLFKNDDWVKETAKLLEEYVAVQPFESVIRLHKDQKIPDWIKMSLSKKGLGENEKLYSLARMVAKDGKKVLGGGILDHGQPGFALAIRREVIDAVGFYDRAVEHSADVIMAFSFYGREKRWGKKFSVLKTDSKAWKKNIFKLTKDSVFFTKGNLFHLWHGNNVDKFYFRKQTLLDKYNFNLKKDITIENDIWKWSSGKELLHKELRDYFHFRVEDENTQVELSGRIRERNLPGTIWGITTFFNPAHYQNKKINYDEFRRNIKRQGLPIVAVELSFDSHPFELERKDAEILVQIRGNEQNILWQKERLFNIALKRLPKDCDKVVWLDCDVIFQDDAWIINTSKLLEQYVVVQPFTYTSLLEKKDGFNLNRKNKPGHADGEIAMSRGAVLTLPSEGARPPEARHGGHPGFAWAIRREVIDAVGFYDRTPIHGADDLMCFGFIGKFDQAKGKLSPKMFDNYKKWAEDTYLEVRGSVGATEGELFHLWHGTRKDRGYDQDNKVLLKYDFDPGHDFYLDKNMIWRFPLRQAEMQHELLRYFYERNEEGRGVIFIRESKLKIIFFRLKRIFIEMLKVLDRFLGGIGQRLKDRAPRIFSYLKMVFPDGLLNLDKPSVKAYAKLAKKNKQQSGFIIVKGMHGLGNRINSVLMAVVYSKITGRKLLIDWSDGMYADKGINAFPLLFKSTYVAKSLSDYLDRKVYPKVWQGKIDNSAREVMAQLGDNSDYPKRDRQILSANLGKTYSEDIIVFLDFFFSPSVFKKLLKEKKEISKKIEMNPARLVRKHLIPQDDIKNFIESFIAGKFRRKMIGVHVRHTDNELAYFAKWNRGVAVEKIITALDQTLKKEKDAGIFVSTDNQKILEGMKEKYENVVFLDKFFDPEDFKPIHLSRNCTKKEEMAKEALIDMCLLARCDYLIYSSKSTFANTAVLLSGSLRENLIDADPDPNPEVKDY